MSPRKPSSPKPLEAVLDRPDDRPLVLVVDDEVSIRTLIGRVLEKQGYRVLLAGTREEGLALFDQHIRDVRLVVLDFHLPGPLGEGTFGELIKRRPNVRIVLVTGDYAPDLGPEASKYHACLLLKPFTTTELIVAVNSVLAA